MRPEERVDVLARNARRWRAAVFGLAAAAVAWVAFGPSPSGAPAAARLEQAPTPPAPPPRLVQIGDKYILNLAQVTHVQRVKAGTKEERIAISVVGPPGSYLEITQSEGGDAVWKHFSELAWERWELPQQAAK